MPGFNSYARPAGAAIAAVLALTTTPLLAQTVVVPPVLPAPEAPAPAAQGFAPAQPVVQPTPSVEDRLNSAIAASEAEASTGPSEAKSAEPRRTSTASAPAKRSTAPAREERLAAVPPPPAAREPAAPQMPSAPARADSQPAQPAVAINSAEPSDKSLFWAAGGGALLLLGIGGAAMMRRRVREEALLEDDIAPVAYEPAMTAADPAHMAEPVMPAPVTSAPAREGSHDSLEAMVAAPPSPENPFRTHAKRLTRARFLLAQQQRQAAPTADAHIETAPAEPPQFRPHSTQTVYRFGSDRSRKNAFTPRTS